MGIVITREENGLRICEGNKVSELTEDKKWSSYYGAFYPIIRSHSIIDDFVLRPFPCTWVSVNDSWRF